MAIYNENYLIELFGFGKKKNKKYEKKKEDNKTKTYTPTEFTEDEVKRVENALKKVVQKYNTDQKIKNRVIELTGKHYDERLDENYCKRSEFVKFHPFKYKFPDWSDYYTPCFVICDQDQEYCLAINDIIYEIAGDAEDELDNEFTLDIGDGDEGCIYMYG